MRARTAFVLIVACASGWASLAIASGSADAESDAPPLYDGDLLSTCDARGLGPQRFAFRCGLASGESQRWGTLRTTALRAEYGLLDNLSAGLSASFHSESREGSGGLLTKQGPGDTRLFLRWSHPSRWALPVTLGLRPALRIPTGYDRDAEGLAPFTTRTVDVELLGLATLETEKLDVFLNPGISLPGEDRATELLAGLGLRVHGGLPLGLALGGEYFTRYNLPERGYRHEAFASLGASLPLGLQAEVGLRKQLIDEEQTRPEIALRFGSGLWRRDPRLPDRRAEAAHSIVLAPVTALGEDPRGLAAAAGRELQAVLQRQPGVEIRADADPEAPRLSLAIAELREGTERGLSVPKLLASPQATCEVHAWLRLADARGNVIYKERPLRVKVKRGMGMLLAPNEGDEDTWVPAGEVRERLRRDAARELAREAGRLALAWLDEQAGR